MIIKNKGNGLQTCSRNAQKEAIKAILEVRGDNFEPMGIKQVLKFAFREFVCGGHLQCLSFVSVAFISCLLLNVDITIDFLIIIYLIFYPIYIYNRFKEAAIDKLTNPARVRHLNIYIRHIPIIFYFSIFLLIIFLAHFSNFAFSIFALSLLLGGILYTAALKNVTKKFIGFKNFYVAAFFSIIVISPVIYYVKSSISYSFLISIIAFAVFVYLKAFIIQVLLDIKDVESDKKVKLSTIPIIFGVKKTISFLKLFNILIITLFTVIFPLFSDIFPKFILPVFLTIPFSFYYFRLTEQKNYFGYIFGSGEFFLWLILILFYKIAL